MNTNLANELIALAVGLITSVLVPFLNRKFGWKLNPTSVGTVATEVLDDAAKAVEKAPPAKPTVSTVPSTATPTAIPAPTQNPSGTEIPVPPMSRPLDLSTIPPHEDGAM